MADWEDAPASSGGWEDAPSPRKAKPPVVNPSASEIAKAIFKANPVVGLSDAALSLASGAVAAPVAGYSGLLGSVLPGPKGQGADWTNRQLDTFTYEPRTELGAGVTKTISYPFVKLSELSDWVGGKTTDVTGSPATGTGVNMALQVIPLVLGRVAPAGEGAASLAKRNALKRANVAADEALVTAREAGYKVPPTQANPSAVNKITEGVGGKIKTAQDLSLKNQPISNDLIRRRFGIPEEQPLNAESLGEVRKAAGQVYERVRGSGRVTADEAFAQKLDAIAEPYIRAAKDFPESARTDIIDAVKGARKESFDAGSAVDQIRILRDKADQQFRSGDKALGRSYRGIADALEDQLGRHLETVGAPENTIADFRRARQAIAETYTVEKHLKPSGNIDAIGLAKELKRKPLQGEIKQVAEFGSNFPRAAQLPEKIGGVPTSPLDAAVSLGSIGGAVASGQPLVALGAVAPYLRSGVRSGITSDWYQNRFAKPREYGRSSLSEMIENAARAQKQPLIPLSEIAEGQRN